jgi:outer membrane protein OmpA-like peptidoglycan-associated protein
LIAAAALPLLLAACATTTIELPELDRAESAVGMLVDDAGVREFAPVEVREAEALLERALDRQREGAERPELLHLAQLARTQVDIARETANLNRLEAQVDQLGARRELLRAEARAARAEREAARTAAERERAEAAAAQAQADRLAEQVRRTQAEREARAAEMQRREEAELREMALREAEAERQQRIAAEQRAAELEAEARRMREEADRLQEQIAELEARPTDRGLVLTLGSDVLFDLDEYELREGAQRTIGRIAEFLNEYEERQVLVEGFTDSTGARDYNLQLSERRAASVRDALIERGVDASRISTRGYGLDYPVATNDTQAGRQLNRRVEVIISEDEQDVPER